MDDIILNNAASLERYLQRIEEEYQGSETEFEKNYTKQDAIILNLLRACETAIDMGAHIIRIKSLGLPQSSREIFVLLENANIIPEKMSQKLQAMVGFRNIAIHNYMKLDIAIIRSILKNDLNSLLEFSKLLVQQ